LIPIGEALKTILEDAGTLEAQDTELLSSLGRVLAQDIYAKDSLPPFDKSAMDGYAVRSEDGMRLRVTDVVRAGGDLPEGLKPGEAFKIMTGAPVPVGADAVVKKEDTEVEGEFVLLRKPAKAGQNILKSGEEIREGDLALRKGSTIRPAEIGLLASLGYSRVRTYRTPRIALLVTGDELVGVEEKLEPGKIRNCNEYSISAMAGELNAEVISYGIVRDDPEEIMGKMKEAFSRADIVVSTGGASVGDYDYVGMTLEKLGADMKFSAVAVKPGKPVIFATYGGKLFFGLPGNPLSVINTFEEFISPAVKKMMGKQELEAETFPVVLENDIKVSTGRMNYAYVFIEKKDGTYYARNAGPQSSNALMTICRANGIVMLDGNASTAKAGETANGKFIFR
jgi:molybdopterin molybdotransferase